MIVFEHPITAHIILVTTTDAKNFAFISDKSPTELWNNAFIVKYNFFGCLLFNIIEVDIFGAPLEVMHKLSRAVRFLQNEGVMKKLLKFSKYINIGIVRYSA